MKMTTLCYLEKGEQYLMLHRTKKENDENRDKWIGIGGKFEDGESPEDCMKREVLEETGLTVQLLDGFRYEDSHPFEKGGETRIKHIVYFLAEYSGQTLIAQESELNSISLMDFDTAMAAFQLPCLAYWFTNASL